MKPAGRIDVINLFPEERAALLDVLRSLSPDEWLASTACEGWSVKDIAAHITADDFGRLSGRDGWRVSWIDAPSWEELVAAINDQNEQWVQAMRRLSSPVIIDMLALAGDQTQAYFRTLDLDAIGGSVDWVGPEPAPRWLDLAREYTERWAHQQQIRDATGRPGLYEPRLFAPVLDAYARALPRTFRDVAAPDGTHVALDITGAAGGRWSVVRERDAWRLYVDVEAPPSAAVTLDPETAWRLLTKGITPAAAREQAALTGDAALAARVLETLSVLA